MELTNKEEKVIEETAANIDDLIRGHYYSREQILLIVNEYLKMDLLAMKYQTREAILYTLCDAVMYYGIKSLVNWKPLVSIRKYLEDDLQEYIDEII